MQFTLEEGILRAGSSQKGFQTTKEDSWISQLISVRSVFVLISLLTVICMAAGLIVLNYNSQVEVADYFSLSIQKQLDATIINEIGGVFKWADTSLYQMKYLFEDKKLPPNMSNLFGVWPDVSQMLWALARGATIMGVEVEIIMADNRRLGVGYFPNESTYYPSYACEFNYNDDSPQSNMSLFVWFGNPNISIANINFSKNNTALVIPFPPPYPFFNFTSSFPTTCDYPHYWQKVNSYEHRGHILPVVSVYGNLCDRNNQFLGQVAMNIYLSRLNQLLRTLTLQYIGEIFVMDRQFQLISSSTFLDTFIYVDGIVTRETVYTTKQRWIRDVFESQKIDIWNSNHNLIVCLNGTKYQLGITYWHEFEEIEWIFVYLLEYNQFMGKTPVYIRTSIITSVAVAIVAVSIVLIVTYFTTKDLTIIARNMQKMASLNFDFTKQIRNPKLIEVKRLHNSFERMNVALRSFQKFVPIEVISEIIRSKKEVVAELQPANITIMFQDIEGFTTLSETMEPKKLAALTSEYMGVMTDIICKHGGTIDKYVGDCIMSLFNTPQEVPDHPTAATAAAVECFLTLLEKNKIWKEIYGAEMLFRTGINSGEVLIGHMGSNNRMNYTAFGDNVNIAARLEGVNKYFGTRIIVSKNVHKTLSKDRFMTRKLAKVKVSGKSNATSVYEVRSEVTLAVEQLFHHYSNALHAFKYRRFDEAISEVEKALEVEPQDIASALLKTRIEEVLESTNTLLPTWSYTEKLVKF